MKTSRKIRWKFGAFAGLVVAAITCIPQTVVSVQRGHSWQGSYALNDTDELVYSAYVEALRKGRPRRNNPYLASPISSSPVTESYFSIQFLPPYMVALGARLLGITTSTAFILLLPLMAFMSSLAIFWLLVEVTGDEVTAAIGVLIISFFGVFASPNPFTAHNNYYAVFSFLRRYLPAVPFPLFFVFCVFVWRSFTRSGTRPFCWAALAGLTLALLIYSYFFLWTAALAWFACLLLFWLIARPADRGRVLLNAGVCGVIVIAALIPYLHLISLRSSTIDRDQALVLSHAPDLFRFTEVLGFLLLSALAFGVYRGTVNWRSPSILFAASCALAPFIAFNQQIVTGRSLQPFHYEQFILNYHLLVGAVVAERMTLGLLLKRRAFVVAIAIIVGAALAAKTSIVNSQQNLRRDEAFNMFKSLGDTPVSNSMLVGHTLLAAEAPTSCSIPVLWSPYAYTYGTITPAEDRERMFQHLYYLNVDEKEFQKLLREETVYQGAVFGVPRINRTLTHRFEPISDEEIQGQVEAYTQYLQGFSNERAKQWPLAYIVVFDRYPRPLSNIDLWYERDAGKKFEGSVMYRLRLRSQQ